MSSSCACINDTVLETTANNELYYTNDALSHFLFVCLLSLHSQAAPQLAKLQKAWRFINANMYQICKHYGSVCPEIRMILKQSNIVS